MKIAQLPRLLTKNSHFARSTVFGLVSGSFFLFLISVDVCAEEEERVTTELDVNKSLFLLLLTHLSASSKRLHLVFAHIPNDDK